MHASARIYNNCLQAWLVFYSELTFWFPFQWLFSRCCTHVFDGGNFILRKGPIWKSGSVDWGISIFSALLSHCVQVVCQNTTHKVIALISLYEIINRFLMISFWPWPSIFTEKSRHKDNILFNMHLILYHNIYNWKYAFKLHYTSYISMICNWPFFNLTCRMQHKLI